MDIIVSPNIDKKRYDNFSGVRVQTPPAERSLFIAVPHNGQLSPNAIFGLTKPVHVGRKLKAVKGNSILTHNFNMLWCDALNNRELHGLTHFAMHHSDIAAPEGWAEQLMDEMDRVDADILSVCVPIKDHRGLRSVGIRTLDRIRRLTQVELSLKFPPTFCIQDLTDNPDACLLVNTGLWVCRFTEQWVEDVCFTNQDWIRQRNDGQFEAGCLSEDWGFSIWAHERGLRVFATSKIKVTHYGVKGWHSGELGEWDTDRGDS